MNGLLTPQISLFSLALILVMVVGLWAGRKRKVPVYLAGRSTRWWGVAGSIFGTERICQPHCWYDGGRFVWVLSITSITAIAGLLTLLLSTSGLP